MSTHETTEREPEEIKGSSNAMFGYVFSVLFIILGFIPFFKGGLLYPPALMVASGFFLAAVLMPDWLAPMNRLWTRFGLLLHRITNPIIMGVIFFGMFTPMGWMKRTFGSDSLGLTFDPEAKSYWVERTPPGPSGDSMKNQF